MCNNLNDMHMIFDTMLQIEGNLKTHQVFMPSLQSEEEADVDRRRTDCERHRQLNDGHAAPLRDGAGLRVRRRRGRQNER